MRTRRTIRHDAEPNAPFQRTQPRPPRPPAPARRASGATRWTSIEHLVGLQAQEPLDPYTGLWCRIDAFDPGTLATALEDKRVVRIALQRSTIHLVTAADALTLRPALQVVQERTLNGTFGRALEGLDLAQVAADGRELVEERPRAFGELGKELAKTYDGRDPLALALAVRTGVALVQPPPRGVWGKGGRALHTSIEAWLGRTAGTRDHARGSRHPLPRRVRPRDA